MRDFGRSVWWWIRMMLRIVPATVEGLPAKYTAALNDQYETRAELMRAYKTISDLQTELLAVRALAARRAPGGFRVLQEKRA